MAEDSPDTRDAQQSRGILAVVLMLLLAGVVTILFAAGNLEDDSQNAGFQDKQSLSISGSK